MTAISESTPFMRRLVPGGTFDLYIRVKDTYYEFLMQTGLL